MLQFLPTTLYFITILPLLTTTLVAQTVTVTKTISASCTCPSPSAPPSSASIWQPTVGSTWQIVLRYPVTDFSPPATIYILDLFDNPVSTITKLHSLNRKVICYFSAGSYENWRPDASQFTASDYSKPLDAEWAGEWWLDTRRANVRKVMSARIKLAKEKGCDGIDPDNVDGYDNDTGFKLSVANGVDYVRFLAKEAKGVGLAMGLKNGGRMVGSVLGDMQWVVNEQCLEYGECGDFQPFIKAGKPVFHIEYPDEPAPFNATTRKLKCNQSSAKGFSTLLKEWDLTNYFETC